MPLTNYSAYDVDGIINVAGLIIKVRKGVSADFIVFPSAEFGETIQLAGEIGTKVASKLVSKLQSELNQRVFGRVCDDEYSLGAFLSYVDFRTSVVLLCPKESDFSVLQPVNVASKHLAASSL